VSVATIVGAGLIGRSWAVVFARAGWTVRLTDANPAVLAAAPGLIRQSLDDLATYRLAGDPVTIAARITPVSSLEDAVADADIVQENGPEREDFKQDIFAQLDRCAPPTALLASSTSFIPASAYTENLKGRARCLVGHPVNPPHLVPVVELCGAPWTARETIERARAIYAEVGQAPVVVNKETTGFVLNRLQAVLLAEAFRLVGEGIVSPQDLDTTIKDGLGLRWSFLGPFETIELNAPGGMADYCKRYLGAMRAVAAEPANDVFGTETIARVLAAWPQPLEPDQIARKTEWRDRRMAALLAHKRDQSDFG
jgi:L-gulonate 3-dehydrogenase